MRKEEAIKIIEQTLNHEYNKNKFQIFLKNLLKQYKEINKTISDTQYIREAFRKSVSDYTILGSFEDNKGNQIELLQVTLVKEDKLARARTTQRNFVADYLRNRGKDGALVAFTTPTQEDWRFSLVKLEYSLDQDNGKIITKEIITPAKRWSFLVGKNEGSHTAQSRFINLLTNDTSPNFNELETAFDIETVTNEFFEKYKELVFNFKEEIDKLVSKDLDLRRNFEQNELSTIDFAKKSLGQIVFLYFLQKKGWFGVASDKDWGEGSKIFIRALFDRRKKYGTNFFNDILEPLFYEALAQDRGENAIYHRLNNTRMPFLNGGLFEPINDYNWEVTNINLPDELFSNEFKSKEGDMGTGILDVFDRYNFTVNENEPLEKEVAVDPEMLGKVFENLLDIKERKSKGSFYTPREIVHYMCQQSLINYLDSSNDANISKIDIEKLIMEGDSIIENDTMALEKIKEHEQKISKYKNKEQYVYRKDKTYQLILPKSIIDNAELLDNLLANIKIADPAVGSGAFPLGMVNEIVKARRVLNIYLHNKLSIYDFKLHAISHSIHGVDIDPSAVEIAKLRLWLSLVVEENIPKPLPNLDHRIMQGNSLIFEYEGIKLFDDSIFDQKKSTQPIQTSLPLGKTPSEMKMDLLQEKSQLYINTSQKTPKKKLKQEIDALKWELIETTLLEQNKKGKLDDVKKLRKTNIKPFFIWKLEFSDVFREKNGFDVVIGNPPYIRIQDLPVSFVKNLKQKYISAIGKFDIYICFTELAINLKNTEGVVSFIMPNKFLHANYGVGLRNYFIDNQQNVQILDFSKNQIFTTATTYTAVYFITNSGGFNVEYYCFTENKPLENIYMSLGKYVKQPNLSKDEPWGLSLHLDIIQLKEKLQAQFIPLADFTKEIFQGIISGGDKLLYPKLLKIKDQSYVVKSNYNSRIYEVENDINHLLLKDNKVKRYEKLNATHVVIYPYLENQLLTVDVLQGSYPKTYNYLLDHKEELEKRGSARMHYHTWYSLWCPRDSKKLNSPKILTQVLSKRPNFSIDTEGDFSFTGGGNAGIYGVIIKDRYDIEIIMAILNSKVFEFLLKQNTSIFRGGYYSYAKRFIERIPISYPSKNKEQLCIQGIVKQITKLKFSSDYNPKDPPIQQKELEAQIDQMVYELYDLTEDEIKIIEGANE